MFFVRIDSDSIFFILDFFSFSSFSSLSICLSFFNISGSPRDLRGGSAWTDFSFFRDEAHDDLGRFCYSAAKLYDRREPAVGGRDVETGLETPLRGLVSAFGLSLALKILGCGGLIVDRGPEAVLGRILLLLISMLFSVLWKLFRNEFMCLNLFSSALLFFINSKRCSNS